MARTTILALTAACVAAVVACGAFRGEDVAAPPDDAGAPDGPSLTDSSSAADGGRFCATVNATLCSDFDDPTPLALPFGWGMPVASGAPPTLDEAVFHSPPRSLHSMTSATNAGLVRGFKVSTSISVDLWAYFDTLLGGGTKGEFGTVQMNAATSGGDADFYATTSGPYFQSGDTAYSDTSGQSLPAFAPKTWHHVFMEVTISADGTKMSASVDGKFAWTDFVLPKAWQPGETVYVRIGITPIFAVPDGGPPLGTWVDDVVVQVQ